MDSATQIEAIASEWLARRDSDRWTDADRVALEAWLDESALHRVAYLRLEDVWEEALRLKALGAGVRTDRPPARGDWHLSAFSQAASPARQQSESQAPQVDPVRPPWGRPRVLALVASLVVAVAAGVSFYGAEFFHGTRYSTPIGGVSSVPMSDGSKVTLNTASEIRVAFTDSERRIDLTQGEAFCEVAKDTGRPFVVDAGDKRVIALGTKFSVRREGDEIRVIVTEGAVRVEVAGKPGEVRGERLAAGTVARASGTGVLLQGNRQAEAEEQLSWRNGILVFRDMTLADVVAEFNRYNVQQTSIADPQIAQLRIAGNFRATDVSAFVRLLEHGYPVRAEYYDRRIVLAPESVAQGGN